MSIFNIITLLGGLAFFLYGMNVMSGGLEKIAGGKFEKILRKMTEKPVSSLVLGAGITCAIQSSSAVTVMLVGLVNSGIMNLQQTVGVIMGSNIGTTLTAWILSLAGIEGDNVFINLLKPDSFAPIFALIGVLLIFVSKRKKKKDVGSILVGFSVLMCGMSLMSGAVEPLADSSLFENMLDLFNNPVFGLLIGMIFTGIIQSSAASVGILQALSMTGKISYGMAIPIIMGQNIGTCVTSLISSIGVNRNAKRVAAIHILFNVIGTLVCLILYFSFDFFIGIAITDDAITPVGIAIVHSIFNLFTTMLLFPFQKLLVKLAEHIIRDKEKKEVFSFLDERLLNTPSFAISECHNMTVKMSALARDTMKLSLTMLDKYDDKLADTVLKNEDELDKYEDRLGTFLVRIASRDISVGDSREVSKLLHTIGDFERIGDHAVNMLKVADEINDKKISFSDMAKNEISVLSKALVEILDITTRAYENGDLELASDVEPLEQVIDGIISEIKNRHIDRLKDGYCTIELGFILSDTLTNFERVSDHCSNIAVALIEVARDSFGTHEYLNAIKTMDNAKFKERYNEYLIKYGI